MFVLRGFILFHGNQFGSKTYFCVLCLAFISKNPPTHYLKLFGSTLWFFHGKYVSHHCINQKLFSFRKYEGIIPSHLGQTPPASVYQRSPIQQEWVTTIIKGNRSRQQSGSACPTWINYSSKRKEK